MAGIAIRRLMRGEDGGIRVALIDLNTLQEVTDPTDYTVLEPDNGKIEDIPYAQQPKSAQTVAEPGEVPVEATTIKEAQEYASGGKLDSGDAATGMRGMERDATNNFGYMSKPKGLGLASMLPGPAGMVGKAVNAGINANNMTASEKARGYLGLSPSSTFGKVKGVLSDNQGVVSKSANIGGFDYGISFGGISKDGKHTTLTPDEARTRSLTLDAPVKEGAVSERGQSYRTPSETGSVAPSSKAVGTLGANSVTQTGTKQGLAGRLGGIEASNPGTVGLAATPESMSAMKDMSAPLGIDAENEADMSGRMSRQWAGSLGDVPAKSVKTGVVSATPSSRPQNVSLGAVTDAEKSSISSNAKSVTGFDRAKDESGAAARGYRSSAVTDPTKDSSLSPSKQAAVSDAYGNAYNAGLTGLAADMSVAQAMHESAWGTKPAGTANLHGIKAAKGTAIMTHEVENGKSVKKSQNFANFTNPEDSYRGWGALMERNYPGVLAAEDEASAIEGLSKGRLGAYATDPNYGKKIADTLDKTRQYSFKNVAPVSAFSTPSITGQISSPANTYADPEAAPSPEKTAAMATKVNSGYTTDLGLMGNLAATSTPESRMGISGSGFSPSSPGGMTGFGRTANLGGATGTSSLSGAARGGLSSVGGGTGSRTSSGSAGASKGTGSVADGSKGNESYGGGASRGTGSLGGNPGAGAYGGGSTKSSGTGGFADGKKGSESYGGGSTASSSKSSSSSSSSKGSASSSSGGPRGGASTGRGMGGFN